MDPNQLTPAAHELPAVSHGNDTAPAMDTQEQPSHQEMMAPMASSQAAPSAVAPPVTPPLAPAQQPVDPAVVNAGHPGAPAIADDLDLIEKEWVEKAKAIVAQTRHDPYAQNKEFNKFKADYMQKRYNKEIKIEQ